MDAYSLKKDNRKKFQDKQRLKARHATPSDRKYRAAAQQEQAAVKEQEVDQVELKSNVGRYCDDVTLAFEDAHDAATLRDVNKKLQTVLKGRTDELDQGNNQKIAGNTVTSKSIDKMTTQELNSLLDAPHPRSRKSSHTDSLLDRKSGKEQSSGQTIPGTEKIVEPSSKSSLLPSELAQDEDFLDSVL